MTLKDILSVSGKPGLYRYVAKARNGIVVESMLDNTRQTVPLTVNASALSDISIYTDSGELPLHAVFSNLKAHDEAAKNLDVKNDTAGVQSLFELVAPNYNKHRVYVHDMQKAIKWYNLLTQCGITDFTPAEEEPPKE